MLRAQLPRSSLAPNYITIFHMHTETRARELWDRNRYTVTWTKQERAWKKVSDEVGLCIAQRQLAHGSKNGSNNLLRCQHPLLFTSVVGHFRCCSLPLWLLYLCCDFLNLFYLAWHLWTLPRGSIWPYSKLVLNLNALPWNSKLLWLMFTMFCLPWTPYIGLESWPKDIHSAIKL